MADAALVLDVGLVGGLVVSTVVAVAVVVAVRRGIRVEITDRRDRPDHGP